MLQQTTVGAVLPRYERFLARFPDVRSLSVATEESVVAEWSGLGYYARARNLHRAARAVVSEHGGEIPRDLEALRELPGFGEYLAAAVATFSYGVAAPAADANVTRILSRLFAIPGSPGTREHRLRVLASAAEILPAENPGDVLAAWMVLGQSICLPRRPRCGLCPLAGGCAAAASGRPESYPERRPRAPMERVRYAAAVVERAGRIWLLRRPAGTWLAGTWAFPAAEGRSAALARRALGRLLDGHGLRLASGPAAEVGRATHTIMRRRFDIEILRAAPPARERKERLGGKWFRREELDRAAVSTLTRKIAKAAGFAVLGSAD